MDTVRDAPLGQLVRWVTGNRVLLHPEEDPKFTLERTSTEGLSTEESKPRFNSPSRSLDVFSDNLDLQGEKPKHVVNWYGPNDPSYPRNWSKLKKSLVALQIWYASKYTLPLSI